MKRREKKLSVMDWVLVGLLDTLAGVVAGGLMAIWQLPSAYRWRGYWAIGGEWLLVIIAIIMAVRLTHAFHILPGGFAETQSADMLRAMEAVSAKMAAERGIKRVPLAVLSQSEVTRRMKSI